MQEDIRLFSLVCHSNHTDSYSINSIDSRRIENRKDNFDNFYSYCIDNLSINSKNMNSSLGMKHMNN